MVIFRTKVQLLQSVREHVQARFASLDGGRLLKAASKVIDPREWPQDDQGLATFGVEEMETLTGYFQPLLEAKGCDVIRARRQEWVDVKAYVRRVPRAQWSTLWEDILADPLMARAFSNFLHLVEIILVLPLATAAVERGFSTMKRVKSDWRSSLDVSMLNRLMYISIEGPAVEAYHSAAAVQRWYEGSERAGRLEQGN